jgi:hypothetical protein
MDWREGNLETHDRGVHHEVEKMARGKKKNRICGFSSRLDSLSRMTFLLFKITFP